MQRLLSKNIPLSIVWHRENTEDILGPEGMASICNSCYIHTKWTIMKFEVSGSDSVAVKTSLREIVKWKESCRTVLKYDFVCIHVKFLASHSIDF